MIGKIKVNMHSINTANFLGNKDRYYIQGSFITLEDTGH